MKISLVKQLNGTFKSAYDSDFEIAKKIKAGDIIEYQFKQVRNVKFPDCQILSLIVKRTVDEI